MRAMQRDLVCDCGFQLVFRDGFFNSNDSIDKKGYAENYTKDYYTSELYDYTSYRLDRIVSLARPGAGRRILDIGCGPGEVAVRCAKRGSEVYGVDVSKDALMLGAERCSREKVEVKFLEFDGEKVPFRDSTFDSIILSDVVEHLEDETLEVILRECKRLLKGDGRLVIHTSPSRNIIYLTKIIKFASLGLADLHSRLISPDYEFLHVRYHSMGSLRRLLARNSLYPVMWGEVQYLADYKLPRLLSALGVGEAFSDQLWCVAFNDRRLMKHNCGDSPYMSLIEPKSEIDLGKCDDIYLNYGFYYPEFDSFRWTMKRCSLFIDVPEGADTVAIKLQTSNPDIEEEPVRVDIYIRNDLISRIELLDPQVRLFNFRLGEQLIPGMAELRLEVDRTFNPKNLNINDDPRELGVVVYCVSISDNKNDMLDI